MYSIKTFLMVHIKKIFFFFLRNIWQLILLDTGFPPPFHFWVGKICCRGNRLPTPVFVFLGFPCGSAGKEPICSVGDLGSIPELGRSPAEGNGDPLQYSCLENSVDRLAESAGVTELDVTEPLSLFYLKALLELN